MKMLNLLIFVALFINGCHGHGYLKMPASRNSMWREGYDTEKNYNDMGMNCGGFANQWDTNDGKCGACGDPYQGPRDHEAGGTFAKVSRPISNCYNSGDSSIDVEVRVTAYHQGYFEFRLCPHNNLATPVSQTCLDSMQLNISGTNGGKRYDINGLEQEYYTLQVEIPRGVTCTQCVFQWKYNAGNSYGCNKNGDCAIGLGPQEQFINCADIAILSACSATTVQGTTGGTTASIPTTASATSTVATQPPAWTSTSGPTSSDDVHSCIGIGDWTQLPYIDDWCTMICNYQIPFCPENVCLCSN